MRTLMNNFYIVYFLTIICFVSQSFAQIQIKQWIDKSEYIEGEPVFLFVRAYNQTNVAVMFSIHSNVEIFVYDNQGKRYNPNIMNNYFYRENLFPDSTYKSFIDIADKYGENAFGKPPYSFFFPYFRKGTYYVYIHWKDKGMEITTPKLYFHIKKPNENQKKLFNEFLNILKISQTRSRRDEGRELIKILLEKYPNNIYTPNIYSLLWIYYKGEKTSFNLADEFIHTFPNHPSARTSLIYVKEYFRRNKDKDGAIKYFTQLKNENLNPDLNRLIEKTYLKRMNIEPIENW